MQAEERIEPSSVAEFLGLHQLDSYAAAFDEEGWDSLQQLRTVDASALEQLITDVKMKRAAMPSACVPHLARVVLHSLRQK
jgi:hypothetical protein